MKLGKKGGLVPTVLNAANEVAVQFFLDKKIKFLEIGDIIEEAINYFSVECQKELSLDNVIELDRKVREYVARNRG